MSRKLIPMMVAVLLVGGVSVGRAQALGGASTGAPTTMTSTAVSVTATTADLEGAITPDGSGITGASFCWGTSPRLSSCTSTSLPSSAYAGLPATSASDPVQVAVSGLSPGTTYHYSLTATNANASGTSSAPYATFTTAAAGPFSCEPGFYQVSADGGGALYSYAVASNTFMRIGTGAVSGVNGMAYDTADNYLYAVSGSTLYRIDDDGQFTSLGTVPGLVNGTGADFYDGELLESAGGGLDLQAVNVATVTQTPFDLTDHAVGALPGAASFTPNDLTVQGNDAYGLQTSPNGTTTLFVIDLADRYLASVPVLGIPGGGGSARVYGAAYSDAEGNAYFDNNSTNIMYEIRGSALAAAIANGTAPTAVQVGSGPSTPGLGPPNDGASCPDAASPFAPTANPPTAGATGANTATVQGVVSPDGSTLSAVSVCVSTSGAVGPDGALTGSPVCVPVDSSTFPYQTWTGTSLGNVAATLAGLSPCTTYDAQTDATNSDGTVYSTVSGFTTAGCQTVSFTSAAPGDAVVGATYSPRGAATSGLPVTITVDAGSTATCGMSGTVVRFTASGPCVLDVDQPGDGAWAAAPEAQQTVTVGVPGAAAPPATARSGHRPVNRVAPVISGTPAIGQTLQASVGDWSGAPVTYSYVWLRDGVPIPGATGPSYLVTSSDAGAQISVRVTASGGTTQVTAVSEAVRALTVDLPGCAVPVGRLEPTAIGPVRLGMSRPRARGLVAATQRLNDYTDNLCLAGGYGIRVGYETAAAPGRGQPRWSPSARIVFETTANPFYTLHGVRPGMTVLAAGRLLDLASPIVIGPNTWYVIPGPRSDRVVKARGGVVQEVGNLSRVLTRDRATQRHLLRFF